MLNSLTNFGFGTPEKMTISADCGDRTFACGQTSSTARVRLGLLPLQYHAVDDGVVPRLNGDDFHGIFVS